MRFRFIKRIFIILTLIFVSLSCNKRVNNNTTTPPEDRISIPKFGTDNTFEIAVWNIENFGNPAYHNVQLQITDVVEIIKDLDIDLFGVEEIGSQSAFDSVASKLEEYNGFLANFSGNQKTGIFYRKSLISILKDTLLFENDSYSFPRPPLMLYLKAQRGNQFFDFNLIVIHLKAYSDQESENRRRTAIQKMEQFISTRLRQGGDPDYVVGGDWNDELEDDSTHNVFLPFLNNPQQYVLLTLPFAGSKTEYSYIAGNFKSLIDHIMVTASIDTTYQIDTQILKIDDYFSQYLAEVSDHRPVAARIGAF